MIPGNDDAIRSNDVIVKTIGAAAADGRSRWLRQERAKREAEEAERKAAEERQRREAEERARKEAEEQARKEAEERQAEAQAAVTEYDPGRRAGGRAGRARSGGRRDERRAAVSFDAKDVKALRDRTGAGMMDCKRALEESGGDAEKAVEILRVKGQAKAAKRGERAGRPGHRLAATCTPTI